MQLTGRTTSGKGAMAELTKEVPSKCLSCGADPFVPDERGLCNRCGAYKPVERVPASRQPTPPAPDRSSDSLRRDARTQSGDVFEVGTVT